MYALIACMIAQLSSELNQVWYCNKDARDAFLARVSSSLKSGVYPETTKDFTTNTAQPLMVSDSIRVNPFFEGNGLSSINEAGSTVVLEIRGVLMKMDDWWEMTAGAESIIKTLKQCEQNANISKVVLDIYGPGGSSLAIRALSDYVKSMATPTEGFANDMAASAHFMLMVSCDVAKANQPMALVGSIGTLSTMVDWTGYYKKLGLKVEEIYADESPEKNKEHRLWKDGDDSAVKHDLSIWANDFIDRVKACRPNVDTSEIDPFKGATIFASDALAIGLIDGIGEIDVAISTPESSTSNSNQTNNNTTMSKFKGFLDFFKKDTAMTPEDLNDLNGQLADKKAGAFLVPVSDEIQTVEDLTTEMERLSTVETDLTTEKTAHTATKTAKDTAEQSLDSIKALFGDAAKEEEWSLADAVKLAVSDAAKWKSNPAGGGVAGTAGAAQHDDAAGADINLDELPHNKMADQLLAPIEESN